MILRRLNMKSASLDLYRTFWAVGKTKNLTKASEQLFITQPGVSLALKNLESQLATSPCGIRSKKGERLTKEGEVLFEELDKPLPARTGGTKDDSTEK
jgi:DNA-binding transcriptional LysR family regulator